MKETGSTLKDTLSNMQSAYHGSESKRDAQVLPSAFTKQERLPLQPYTLMTIEDTHDSQTSNSSIKRQKVQTLYGDSSASPSKNLSVPGSRRIPGAFRPSIKPKESSDNVKTIELKTSVRKKINTRNVLSKKASTVNSSIISSQGG